MKIYDDVLATVGATPTVRISRFATKVGVKGEILVKIEGRNPGGSAKDRVAIAMLNSAKEGGMLSEGGTVIEPTSGNTGIGLAMACAVMGYKLILTMPSSMSVERRKILSALGAQIVLTPAEKGMTGANEEAERLHKQIDGSIIAGQFDNPQNPDAHRKSTALEILSDTEGEIDCFVAGIGTGGTITGVGEVLKEKIKGVKIVGVEPADSPLLTKGHAGTHKIQGIGANFIPKVLNMEVVDEVLTVTTSEAYECARLLAKSEGFTCGISGGAALAGAIKVLEKTPNKRVLVLLPDSGDKYLSTDLFE